MRGCIVAFAAYRIPKLIQAINSCATSGVDVMCVFESQDASSGKVAVPSPKQLGLVPKVRVFVWPLARRQKNSRGLYGCLHAKCAAVDGELLFVSSANLTESAFNLNMELGVLIRGGSLPCAIESHFRALISAGYLVRA
jgi:phosphatidylserine/phosphatidylglycerophosphate/cardiolipin synthase-like enzyme